MHQTTEPAAPDSATLPVATLHRWRGALFAAFFVTGLSMATWVTRTPDIRDVTGASTAQMGLIIAGLSVGSMVGISVGGALVARRGGRFVVRWGMTAIVAGVATVALATAAHSGVLVAVGLALFGYGMGSGEIGQNVEGVALEQQMRRTVVPSLHGCYSLGIFVGGLTGLAANAVALPVTVHLLVAAAVTAAASVWLVVNLPAATGRESARETGPSAEAVDRPGSVWREPRTVAIAVVILGMALAEGSANDWLPLIMVDGFALTATVGALIYAGFGGAMAVGRFAGGALLDRFGRTRVLLTSAALAATGIAAVAFAPNAALGGAGVVLWGLGASLGFPVALSAAGDDPVGSARRVSAVATAGYAAFLVGPPVLGLLGEHWGLRGAIVVVLVMVGIAAVFIPRIRPLTPAAPSAPVSAA